MKFWELEHWWSKHEWFIPSFSLCTNHQIVTSGHSRCPMTYLLAVRYSQNGNFAACGCPIRLSSQILLPPRALHSFRVSFFTHFVHVASSKCSFWRHLVRLEVDPACSTGRNVLTRGLDFYDCHKSIFAYEENIMQLIYL